MSFYSRFKYFSGFRFILRNSMADINIPLSKSAETKNPTMKIELSSISFPSKNNFEIDSERKDGGNPNSYEKAGILLIWPKLAKPQSH